MWGDRGRAGMSAPAIRSKGTGRENLRQSEINAATLALPVTIARGFRARGATNLTRTWRRRGSHGGGNRLGCRRALRLCGGEFLGSLHGRAEVCQNSPQQATKAQEKHGYAERMAAHNGTGTGRAARPR